MSSSIEFTKTLNRIYSNRIFNFDNILYINASPLVMKVAWPRFWFSLSSVTYVVLGLDIRWIKQDRLVFTFKIVYLCYNCFFF